MAVWQFNIQLVSPEGVSPLNMSLTTAAALVDELMERSPVQHEGSITWGDHLTTDLNIDFSESDIEEISIRLDLRRDYQEGVAIAIALARHLGRNILIKYNREIIEPLHSELDRQVRQSPAAKFVADPAKFLVEFPDH